MDPTEKVVSTLLNQGPMGLAILFALVIVVLWRRVNTLQEQATQTGFKTAEELKKLAVSTAEGLVNSSQTNAAFAIAMERGNTLQQQMLDLVRGMPGQHEMLAKMLDRNGDKMDDIKEAIRDMQRGGRS